MKQQQANFNQEHKTPDWVIIGMIILAFVLGVITGTNRACGQTPAIMKGYFGKECVESRVLVGCDFSEDNRELDFSVNGDTVHFDVAVEKMTILNDSVIRTEYILDKNGAITLEPAYSDGVYIGDYCKMILRRADPFDRVVILFWSEPDWNEDITRYQWPASAE